MKIIFMGTPEFSVPILENLIKAHEVTLVITQPDRPAGRHGRLLRSAVAVCADTHGIPVLQPERIKRKSFFKELIQFEADVIIVAAYGQILPERILNYCKFGCINVHASLLPKLRGAAPIQWAIIEGHDKTGVTIMQMDKGLDTGDMLLKEEVIIDTDETGGTLHDKLAKTGADLIIRALILLSEGRLSPEKQDDSKSTYAHMLNKGTGRMNLNDTAQTLVRLVNGLNPYPSAFLTMCDGKTLKVHKAEEVAEIIHSEIPGKILSDPTQEIILACGGNTALKLLEIQEAGGKAMKTKDYLRGHILTSETFMTPKN